VTGVAAEAPSCASAAVGTTSSGKCAPRGE
jgi:hypothetical protein